MVISHEIKSETCEGRKKCGSSSISKYFKREPVNLGHLFPSTKKAMLGKCEVKKQKKLSRQKKSSSGNDEKRFYVDPFMNLVMPHQLPDK